MYLIRKRITGENMLPWAKSNERLKSLTEVRVALAPLAANAATDDNDDEEQQYRNDYQDPPEVGERCSSQLFN